MSGLFTPSWSASSTYKIDFRKYYELGFRGLIFDIDNTLVPHDAPYTSEAKELFKELSEIGFKTCILSNNDEARVKPFADALGASYVFLAHKPEKKGYLYSMDKMGTDLTNTLFIGDQFLTDILGANCAGMKSIMVGIIDPNEKKSIQFKRKIEKIIRFFIKHKLIQAFEK